MNARFSTSFCAAVILLAGCISYSASAALQLVTTSAFSIAAPPDGNGDSFSPIVSPDGRYVLFASTANNLSEGDSSNGIPELNPPVANVYLRDRLAQTTTLVSVNLWGNGGNGNSFPTALSTNGQFALFESVASDLVTNATNGLNEVFLRDVVNGITSLVSVGTNGTCPDDVSRSSTMSPDGRYIAFVSAATNLVPNDTNGIPDVFVRDMQAGATTLASVGAVPNGTGCSSEGPEITPDGRYVVFSSSATNLLPGMTLPAPTLGWTPDSEIYVRDLQAGATTWASTNALIMSRLQSGFCYNQAISDNGQYVAFEISSNSPGDPRGTVYYYNLQNGVTETIVTNAVMPSGTVQTMRSLNMTPDGQSIVFVGYGTNSATGLSFWTAVYLWNAQNGTNVLVSANPTNGINAYSPDIDPTGRYVVFVSTDAGTNYTATTNTAAVVALCDTQAGTTTAVSVNTNGAAMWVNATAVPALSCNAGTVAFESPWANLDGRNYYNDVFALDLTNTVSQLISVHAPNLSSVTPNGPSSLWAGSVSTNGRFMALSSWANNVTPNGTNGDIEVFVRDLVTGTNILVSVASNGAAGNNLSTEPSVSGDGRYVAFTSNATNLMAADSNFYSDVFVRDMREGLTTLVSVDTNGGFGNGSSYLPQISSDGRYVLFCSAATTLTPNVSGGNNLFLRDMDLSQTYALTTNGYGSAGGFSSWSMTPDGNYIAFVGISGTVTNLFVWSSPAASLIYTNTSGPFANVSLSPDGHWLAYVANGQLFAQDLIADTNCQIASGAFGSRAGLKFSTNCLLTYSANSNIYLYSFLSGSNLLVSTAYESTNPANGIADSPVISADGSLVAYRSFSSNAIPSDTNGIAAILLYNCLSNSTSLASANLSGVSPVAQSLTPIFSADGQMLVFESWAPDLVSDDFNVGSDVFAMDLYGQPGAGSTNPPPVFSANLAFQGYGGYSLAQVPVVSWPFIPSASYSVQYTDNLNDPVWQTLPGAITFIGTEAYLSDSAATAPYRFYRIVQNP